jgi:alanine racemase
MIDLGQNKDIKVGDEVVLIGQRGSLKITAEDIANWANTIPYEIVSRLSFKIPRIYKYRSNAQDNAGNSE